MTIDLVFITYNRLEYSKLALASVLADPTEEFSLTIWDNGSTDDTREYLESVDDPRIKEKIFSKENIGQTAAVNEIWSKSKAELLGKLDNDCIVTPGWSRTLSQAHKDIPNLGVVAMWHFFADDFDYQRAKHKIEQFNGHKIFRHPWTCGTGVLLKREIYNVAGPITSRAMPPYWLKIAKKGYINGFYFPLVFQEHMDDPKSKYCQIKDAQSFEAATKTTVGLQAGRYHDLGGRMQWRQEIIRNLLDDPYDPFHYTGWRHKVRSIKKRIVRNFSFCRKNY